MANHQNIQQRVAGSSAVELNLEYAASIMLKVFNAYDVDQGGTLQRRELRRLLRECGSKLTHKECETIIKQMDTDGDGKLYQLQFFGSNVCDFWNRPRAQQALPSPPTLPPPNATNYRTRPPPPLPGNHASPHQSPVASQTATRPLPPPPVPNPKNKPRQR